jgi:hypothetical protein
VTINDLEAKGVDLGELDSETLAGAVVERLGRLARAGDTVRFGEWEARVDQVRPAARRARGAQVAAALPPPERPGRLRAQRTGGFFFAGFFFTGTAAVDWKSAAKSPVAPSSSATRAARFRYASAVSQGCPRASLAASDSW